MQLTEKDFHLEMSDIYNKKADSLRGTKQKPAVTPPQLRLLCYYRKLAIEHFQKARSC